MPAWTGKKNKPERREHREKSVKRKGEKKEKERSVKIALCQKKRNVRLSYSRSGRRLISYERKREKDNLSGRVRRGG